MNKRLALVASMSALVFLAACGGGGGGSNNDANGPVTQIPTSANASIAALAAFFVAQFAALSDTTEPLDINNVGDFVTSDTTEPSAI
jgi:hypothetical protein